MLDFDIKNFDLLISYRVAGRDIEERVPLSNDIDLPNLKVICGFNGDVGLLNVLLRPTIEIQIQSLALIERNFLNDSHALFVNGIQSWSASREFSMKEILPPLRGPVQSKMNQSGDYTFIPYRGGEGEFHSHGYTWSVKSNNEVKFRGSMMEKTGYTLFETLPATNELKIAKNCEMQLISADFKHSLVPLGDNRSNQAIVMYFSAPTKPNISRLKKEILIQTHSQVNPVLKKTHTRLAASTNV